MLVIAARADAHPVPFSYLDLRLEPDKIEGTLVAHIFDLAHDLNVDPPERLLEPSVIRTSAPAVIALLAPRLTVASAGRALTPTWSSVETLPERQSVRLRVQYALESPAGTVTVTARLFPYDPNHQTFVNVYENTALTQAILDRGRPEFEYFAGTRQGVLAVMRKFIPAGIHHILIGPDHLLFLVGLLLLGVTMFSAASDNVMLCATVNDVTTNASWRIVPPSSRRPTRNSR